MMKKLLIVLFALILSYTSNAADITSTTEKLRDSLLCKGSKTRKQFDKLIQPHILKKIRISENFNRIKLKQPVDFWGIKTDTLIIGYWPPSQTPVIYVLFRENYLQVAKKIPFKFRHSLDPEDDPSGLYARVGSRRIYLEPANSSSEYYKTTLTCLTS